jgi:hypothetical protein
MCFDAPKDHIILPCYHVCVCEACANLLMQMMKPSCPICRTAIQHTNKVFHSEGVHSVNKLNIGPSLRSSLCNVGRCLSGMG